MLKQRIMSCFFIIPLPIVALYFGTPWFELFVAMVLTMMGWEWEKMVSGRFTVLGMLIAVTGICSIFLLDISPIIAWALPALMSIILYVIAKRQGQIRCKLFAFGVLYSAYPMLSIMYLLQTSGFLATLWLFGLVWAMDTGAYVFGRLIGGVKLCPKISPKKTWAGLIGGMVTAGILGAVCAYFLKAPMGTFALLTAFFGGVSQMGDLFESWIKRGLNIKDSSSLIPGHGGIFDRVDALLFVSPIVVLWIYFIFPSLDFWGY